MLLPDDDRPDPYNRRPILDTGFATDNDFAAIVEDFGEEDSEEEEEEEEDEEEEEEEEDGTNQDGEDEIEEDSDNDDSGHTDNNQEDAVLSPPHPPSPPLTLGANFEADHSGIGQTHRDLLAPHSVVEAVLIEPIFPGSPIPLRPRATEAELMEVYHEILVIAAERAMQRREELTEEMRRAVEEEEVRRLTEGIRRWLVRYFERKLREAERNEEGGSEGHGGGGGSEGTGSTPESS